MLAKADGTGSGRLGPGATSLRERADSDISSVGATKGYQVAAGGREVSHASGATDCEAKLRGRYSPKSGHQAGHAQSNSRPLLKRHFRLDIPKSSSGFVPCQTKSSDKEFQIPREEAVNFLPTHPPQQNTAMPLSPIRSTYPETARTVGRRLLPQGFSLEGSDGPVPSLP